MPPHCSDRHGRVGFLGLVALAALIGWFGSPAFGGPVLTEPVTLTQPDGTTFVARPGGDEWFNWFSYEGALIVRDETGWWRYARDVDGALKGGLARAAVDAVPAGAQTIKDVPRLSAKVVRPQGMYAAPGSATALTEYHRGLVILVEFQDVSISTSDAYWSNLFFGSSGKTVRNYLAEVSGGDALLTAVGDACCPPDYVSDGVIRVRLQPSDHNGGNHPNPGGTINDSNRWIVYDALYRADAYEAFNAFDNSGDGVITPNELHIFIVVAGYDRGYGDVSTPAVIGHRWSLGFTYGEYVPPVVVDGVQLCTWVSGDPTRDSGYMQIGELHGDHAATVGEPCHEFGHDLGLPDLYDTTGASSGIGGHGLMGYGGWGMASGDAYFGQTPTHLCPWSKQKLGWVTPQVLSANADHTLVGTGSASYNVLRVNTSDANQYFLIENRQLQGFDAGLYRWFSASSGGSGGGGLAIWHVDESIANNNSPARKKVDLEEANQGSLGYSELDTLANQGNRHHYFYSGHVGDFGNATTPDSRLYNGTSTDINVSSISLSGSAMKCYVAIEKRAALEWATYLGTANSDYAYDLAIDGSENIYVTGPVLETTGSFVTKLGPDGSFVWSSTISGGLSEGIDVDSSGRAYVTGCAVSWFAARPSSGYGDPPPYAYDTSYNGGNGCGDVFVARLGASGSTTPSGGAWATFLGGSYYTDGIFTWGGVDKGMGIAVNSSGEPVVTGQADCRDFSGTTAGTYGHYGDGFVTKLNATGTGLLYSRYLPEHAYAYPAGTMDVGFDVAYDPSGNAWIVGRTDSNDFDPCYHWTSGFQSAFGGYVDAFFVKVGTTGSILAASYLGGYDLEYGMAIAVDTLGYPYATGFVHSTGTMSPPFPLVNAYDSYNNWQTGDAYITKANTGGTGLMYSTFFGGHQKEHGYAIDVDAQGNMYLAGFTESDDLQVGDNAPFRARAGGKDAFLAKISADGSTLDLGTYLGGSGDDEAHGVAVGSSGAIYVAGFTQSSDFPTTPGAYDETHNGGYDAFVAKLALEQMTDSLVVGIPDGGETWCVDQSTTIRWSSSGAGSYVKIELSRDGNDGPWEALYASTDNDGAQAWTVAGAESANCYLRITDAADGTLTDMGNAAFTITTCSPIPDPPTTPAGEAGYRKVRYISFEPGNPGMQTALRVTFVSLHHADPPYTGGASVPFTLFESQSLYVGPPTQYVESVSSGTPFYASQLRCTPYYQDWTAINVLHVTGEAVVPSSTYNVENLDASCAGSEASCTAVSTALEIKTTRWGDVVDPFNPPSTTTQPDTGDFSALVNKFKSALGAPIKSRALLAGANQRGTIDPAPDVGFTHISLCVDAFKGLPYPYKPGKCTGNETKACATDADCTNAPNPTTGPCILCP